MVVHSLSGAVVGNDMNYPGIVNSTGLRILSKRNNRPNILPFLSWRPRWSAMCD